MGRIQEIHICTQTAKVKEEKKHEKISIRKCTVRKIAQENVNSWQTVLYILKQIIDIIVSLKISTKMDLKVSKYRKVKSNWRSSRIKREKQD